MMDRCDVICLRYNLFSFSVSGMSYYEEEDSGSNKVLSFFFVWFQGAGVESLRALQLRLSFPLPSDRIMTTPVPGQAEHAAQRIDLPPNLKLNSAPVSLSFHKTNTNNSAARQAHPPSSPTTPFDGFL